MTASIVYTITAPTLVGTWLHAVADPQGTSRNYQFVGTRPVEAIEVQSAKLDFIGRRFSVYEFGPGEDDSLNLKLATPFGTDHDASVQWLRDAVRSRRVLCYRDNRSRIMFGMIDSKIGVQDDVAGSTLTFTLNRVDFSEGDIVVAAQLLYPSDLVFPGA